MEGTGPLERVKPNHQKGDARQTHPLCFVSYAAWSMPHRFGLHLKVVRRLIRVVVHDCRLRLRVRLCEGNGLFRRVRYGHIFPARGSQGFLHIA